MKVAQLVLNKYMENLLYSDEYNKQHAKEFFLEYIVLVCLFTKLLFILNKKGIYNVLISFNKDLI